jgi:hypothetical protein
VKRKDRDLTAFLTGVLLALAQVSPSDEKVRNAVHFRARDAAP